MGSAHALLRCLVAVAVRSAAPAPVRPTVPEVGGAGPGCSRIDVKRVRSVVGSAFASIGLHKSLGFREVGVLRSVGFKFDRWVDSVLMQRALGAGDSTPP
jgi:hypothetical protein